MLHSFCTRKYTSDTLSYLKNTFTSLEMIITSFTNILNPKFSGMIFLRALETFFLFIAFKGWGWRGVLSLNIYTSQTNPRFQCEFHIYFSNIGIIQI